MKVKNVFIPSVFSILIFLQCSGKNNPVQTESEKVIIAAATGGSLSLANGITLNIPASALNEKAH